MKQGLCVLGLLLWAAPVLAAPITYQLVEPAQPTLIGSFTLDHAQANPFVSWQFQYVWPEAAKIIGYSPEEQVIIERFPSPILGRTWGTDDGGLWNTRSHTLVVTNDEDLKLNFQLCYLICSDHPNTWVMSIFDPHYVLYDPPGVLYSGGGLFAGQSIASPAIALGETHSVPEPGAFWLLVSGLGLAGIYRRSRYALTQKESAKTT